MEIEGKEVIENNPKCEESLRKLVIDTLSDYGLEKYDDNNIVITDILGRKIEIAAIISDIIVAKLPTAIIEQWVMMKKVLQPDQVTNQESWKDPRIAEMLNKNK